MSSHNIKFLYFLFVIVSFTSACNEANDPLIEEEVITMEEEVEIQEVLPSYNYLALGDSYTIGQGVAADERFPVQLQRRLLEDSIVIDSVTVVAVTGWTTSNLLNGMDAVDLGQSDIVSLLIGVNNQFQGRPFSMFEEDLLTLLDRAEALCLNGKEGIFVLSIPDYGVTPFGASNSEQIAADLDRYNEYAKEICDAREIPFVDITELSRMLGADYGALASDNLHPSAYQYSKWVTEMLPTVKQLFD